MKKIVAYVFLIILICFGIPVIFTNKKESIGTISFNTIEENQVEISGTDEKSVELQTYDYKQYNLIKLLHRETNEVEEIELDNYLCGVISAEMPASYEIEALKAQATVARSYTLHKIINAKPHGDEANICDSYKCCQAWISKEDRFAKWSNENAEENWSKIVTAVNDTKGKVITYDGKIINAFFHANSGGKTEIPVNVWGGTDYPYLQVVETSGEDAYTQYSSEIDFTIDELVNKFSEKYNELVIDEENLQEEIKILNYTEGGRVKTLKIGNKEIAGTEVRSVLGLRSTNFDIIVNQEKKSIKFSVTGYGHGIGMSQTGADAMAKQGSDYEQIIKHFYIGVEIVDI